MNRYYIKVKKRSKKPFMKLLGVALIGSGVITLVYFFFPIVSYNIFLAKAFAEGSLEVPVPKYLVVKNNSLGNLLSQGVASLTTDFTDARNWYPQSNHDTLNREVKEYSLSIPKLKIENALVSTTDYDLAKHLVQYFGTSVPGHKGTAVIFGHSTLPQLFSTKDYKAIFATLHTLQEGDEIFARIGDALYRYTVFSRIITTPEDTQMFFQDYDNSYITLVTCTPPGTVWKRLLVRARLESLK